MNQKNASRILRLALVLFAVAPSFAKEKWILGNLDEIQIISNATPGKTRLVVKELRDLRNVMAATFPTLVEKQRQPIRLYITKDQNSTKRFSRIVAGKPLPVAGFFTRDEEGPIVLVNASYPMEVTGPIIYHEYIHFLTAARDFSLPLWLSEGLAETFSTIKIDKKSNAIIGTPDPFSINTLLRVKPIPLERFFAVNHSSPEYVGGAHGRSIFYSQSWAITHYLLLGNSGLPNSTFSRLLAAAVESAPNSIDEPTFRQITGVGFEEMEKRLRQYVEKGRYTQKSLPLPADNSAQEFAMRDASQPEIDVALGRLLLRMRSVDEALPLLLKAEAAQPNAASATALAFLELNRDNDSAAFNHFGDAIARGSPSGTVYLYRAVLEFGDWLASNDSYNSDKTASLLKSLFKARELGINSELLYQSIAHVWASSTVTPREAHLDVIAHGANLYPDNFQINYLLAKLYFRIGLAEKALPIVHKLRASELDSGDAAALAELDLPN